MRKTVGQLVLSVFVGLFVGVMSGLLGIGGGMIMVPAFRLVFDMSAVASTATSLFTIIPTSVTGAIAHVRSKTCIPKLGLALGLGGALTSPLGVWLAQLSPGWLVMAATALVIGYSAFTMLRKALKAPKKPAGQADASVPQFSMPELGKAAVIGMVAGVASGFVGLGGGFIMVPLMVSVLGIPMRLGSGTSLIAVMILALPGAVMQCLLGNVDYLVGLVVACGSIPGALLGARLVKHAPERILRFIFAGFLGVAAILLLVKETGLLA